MAHFSCVSAAPSPVLFGERKEQKWPVIWRLTLPAGTQGHSDNEEEAKKGRTCSRWRRQVIFLFHSIQWNSHTEKREERREKSELRIGSCPEWCDKCNEESMHTCSDQWHVSECLFSCPNTHLPAADREKDDASERKRERESVSASHCKFNYSSCQLHMMHKLTKTREWLLLQLHVCTNVFSLSRMLTQWMHTPSTGH